MELCYRPLLNRLWGLHNRGSFRRLRTCSREDRSAKAHQGKINHVALSPSVLDTSFVTRN